MKSLWFICPFCRQRVSFSKQISDLFDEEGEADFDPEKGIICHSIVCSCGASWYLSMSGAK